MELRYLIRILGIEKMLVDYPKKPYSQGEKLQENTIKTIKVKFPSIMGDTSRTMTVQELKEDYKDYLIIDPRVGEQVDIDKLANLEIPEVVVMPPISGG